MSTSCMIGILDENDNYKFIFAQKGGQLSVAGYALVNKFKTEDDILPIIERGDRFRFDELSYAGDGKSLQEFYLSQNANGSDYGEETFNLYKTREETLYGALIWALAGNRAEIAYILKDGVWKYTYVGGRGVQYDVAEDLEELGY